MTKKDLTKGLQWWLSFLILIYYCEWFCLPFCMLPFLFDLRHVLLKPMLVWDGTSKEEILLCSLYNFGHTFHFVWCRASVFLFSKEKVLKSFWKLSCWTLLLLWAVHFGGAVLTFAWTCRTLFVKWMLLTLHRSHWRRRDLCGCAGERASNGFFLCTESWACCSSASAVRGLFECIAYHSNHR